MDLSSVYHRCGCALSAGAARAVPRYYLNEVHTFVSAIARRVEKRRCGAQGAAGVSRYGRQTLPAPRRSRVTDVGPTWHVA